jgi:hypothetical protein
MIFLLRPVVAGSARIIRSKGMEYVGAGELARAGRHRRRDDRLAPDRLIKEDVRRVNRPGTFAR